MPVAELGLELLLLLSTQHAAFGGFGRCQLPQITDETVDGNACGTNAASANT